MRWIAVPLICVAVAATAATAQTGAPAPLVVRTGPTPPLYTGLGDPVFGGSHAAAAFALARQAGATYARLFVNWWLIAPKTLPVSGFDPADPTSPAYDWESLDASVSAAKAAGITPILDIVAPPRWAFDVPPGKWKGGSPKIQALGAFATALATQYDGFGSAPAEHIFSVWNEPNYGKNLYPQSPTYYRSMVNAVADSVHAVNRSNLVLAGELAPFRNMPGGSDRNHAIPPLTFMRSMLCISNTKRPHRTCHTQAKFDVWTHHPYSDSGPFGHAKFGGGVQLADLPKMNALLQTAEQLGAIDSARPVEFWVTEVGWSSSPPNKHGVPIGLESRWVAEAMYQMWKSGVTVGTWFLLWDQPPNTPFQSGLYFRASSLGAAVPKPLLAPFSFPFVAYLKRHGKVQIWGRDTTSDEQDVAIQAETYPPQGPWKTVATIRANSYGIFQATLPLGAHRGWSLQATAAGSGSSRPFSLWIPNNENLRVTPFPPN